MSNMLTLCRWVQETRLSAILSESTWGVPIVGALHVLALALFGGAILLSYSKRNDGLRAILRAGIAVLLITGGLLFWSQPVRYYQSAGFRGKLVLLIAIAAVSMLPETKARAYIALSLWAAVIFASRAIAYL
jgi:hypothetical protein